MQKEQLRKELSIEKMEKGKAEIEKNYREADEKTETSLKGNKSEFWIWRLKKISNYKGLELYCE